MPTDLPSRRHRHLNRFPAKYALGLNPRVNTPIREIKARQNKRTERDRDSIRNEHILDRAVVHFVMAPIAALFFSTLMQGNTISMASLFRTLLLSAEAIAEAELGFGQGWIGNI